MDVKTTVPTVPPHTVLSVALPVYPTIQLVHADLTVLINVSQVIMGHIGVLTAITSPLALLLAQRNAIRIAEHAGIGTPIVLAEQIILVVTELALVLSV